MSENEEPEHLTCPISRVMFRDPVVVLESGHTYEREEILKHIQKGPNPKEPLTGQLLEHGKLIVTNWAVRNAVQAWLDDHPDVTPDGWDSREVPRPSNDDTIRLADETLLMKWSRQTPLPNDRWSRVATMENGRIAELKLECVSKSELEKTAFRFATRDLGKLRSLKRLRIRYMPNAIWNMQILGQITSLVNLDLTNNKLKSEDLRLVRIRRLRALKALDLSNNKLTSVPAEIGQLTSLRNLNLSKNKLTSLPDQIGRLKELRLLNLGFNKLTSLPKLAMAPHVRGLNAAGTGVILETHMTELILNNNKLTSLPAEIWCKTSLTSLNLSNNQLTSLPDKIGRLTSLKTLHVSDNQLTSMPAEIGQLTWLERLELDNNQLTSLPAEIGQLTSLKWLELDNNQLTSLPAEIGQLTSLKKLFLYKNQLTSVPAEIGQLTSLEKLFLHDNQLTSLPTEMGQLTSMNELNIENNPPELMHNTNLSRFTCMVRAGMVKY